MIHAIELEPEAEIASALIAARRDGQQISVERVTNGITTARAYAIQAVCVVKFSSSTPIGWKLGATTKSTQQSLGLSEPFFGPIFDNSLVRNTASVLRSRQAPC